MSANPVATQEYFAQAVKLVAAMRTEIDRAFTGQLVVVDQVLAAMLAGGHVLLEGVPGLGKTLLVRAIAKTFDGQFARIQFTPDLMPADVTGHVMFDQSKQVFVTRRGPVFTNLLLADEINRAPAKTQSALLEVMQEGQVTIEGQAHALGAPFIVFATQNPIEQEGTYALPEAQLDRFLLKIRIDHLSGGDELSMVKQVTAGSVGDRLRVDHINTIVKAQAIAALQTITASLHIDDRVIDYAVRIVRATREWSGIATGAGPRGGIALVRAARAAALMAERDFVVPEDVRNMALPALRHRITPSPDIAIEGHGADELLKAVLEKVEAPRK
ncbi:MAG: AAA family ATPase [Burkholderiales bacterium]